MLKNYHQVFTMSKNEDTIFWQSQLHPNKCRKNQKEVSASV